MPTPTPAPPLRAVANCRSAPATASPSSPAPTTTARHSTAGATSIINGTTPQARFWTVTLYDSQGRLVANSIDRYGFTSQEIVRRADGSFEIAVAPRARPSNWLPTGGIESYVLMLRLYDTPVGVATRAAREAPMPAIQVRSCS